MAASPDTPCTTDPVPSETSGAATAENATTQGPVVPNRYAVVSVELAATPDGGQGTDWCRYVLSCGSSRITGLRRGTLDEVTAFAASSAEDFNLRSAGGKGKAGVAYSKKTSPIPAVR